MFLKKASKSLTVRIFLLTFAILFFACTATFLILAWVTPVSYVSVITSSEFSNLITGTDRNGQDIAITTQTIDLTDAEKVIVTGQKDDNSSVAFYYTDSYAEQTASMVVQAFFRIAPWLIALILIFSVLCAFFYSRFITRPIVRLSGISQKMADMDFSWKCNENRSDEIGLLGQNLDSLSGRLSATLSELNHVNAELQRDIERERDLEKSRLDFFSAVSHELKTPITILKGQLNGMLGGVDIYQDRDMYLAKSLRVTGRMEALVQELLAVVRMESISPETNKDTIDISALAENRLEVYGDLIEQKEMTLMTEITPGLTVRGEEQLLSKALDNIISNAVLYSPEKGTVSVVLKQHGDQIQLDVINSGAHIPEDMFAHIFEAFFRAEQSRSRSTGGSGLGLYLVRMILDRHGADYSLKNTSDGVMFSVCFPAP